MLAEFQGDVVIEKIKIEYSVFLINYWDFIYLLFICVLCYFYQIHLNVVFY